MNVRRLWIATVAFTCIAVLAGCTGLIEPSGAAPTSPSTGTLATTTTTTVRLTFEPGATVPDANAQAVGCVDEPGTLRASARAWYHAGAKGVLSLSGQVVQSDKYADFGETVEVAVQQHVQSFIADTGYELAAQEGSCVIYRSVQFVRRDGGAIVVSAFRADGAVDPYWIPSEVAFATRNDSTLVSDGAHIRVALLVAPDGTTVRVAAYGTGELQAVSGWPTTSAPTTPTVAYGDAPATIEQIVAIGNDVLTYSLRR
jgi:hypothetical protein